MAKFGDAFVAGRDRVRDAGGESLQLVVDYVKQETVEPITSPKRFLTYGALGSFLLGLGLMFYLIAILRVLQEETGVFQGNWSWVPYLIDAAVAIVVMFFVAQRITAGPATRRVAISVVGPPGSEAPAVPHQGPLPSTEAPQPSEED